MISYVFKRSNARLYSGRYRLTEEGKITQVELGCTNRQVAEKKLREIVQEKEREAAGMLAPRIEREAAQKPLSEHLGEMIAEKSSVRDSHYLSNLKHRVFRLIADCGWAFVKNVSAESFEKWRSGQTLSAKASNEYLISARSLLNWMEKRRRITFNPLKSLELLPLDEQKRRPRRALSDAEFGMLVISSGDRGIGYLVAATTGLRYGEMNKVERRDVRFDEGEAKIVARAFTTKNRKGATLVLHIEVADRLRVFLEGQGFSEGDKVFAPMFRKRGHLKRDLAAAGVARFDSRGRVADFHSLRYTFCTNLQKLDTPQRVLMHLMRHSDRRLSDHLYTDTSLLPATETVQKLYVPRHAMSQIQSQDLVADGQGLSHGVMENGSVEGPKLPSDLGLCQRGAETVTASPKHEMVRDAGFEPATSCV
jgi:integrase